ncbi:hypothetical protein [Pseudomonas peli]|nr:hypothetical protein [Pseudomonas peli]
MAINLVEATRKAEVNDSEVDLRGSAGVFVRLDGEIWGVRSSGPVAVRLA